jgi:hypothetical protein
LICDVTYPHPVTVRLPVPKAKELELDITTLSLDPSKTIDPKFALL